MTLFLIGGTNGAGKSTFIANGVEQAILPPVEYVSQGFHNANYFSKMPHEQLDMKRVKAFHTYKIDRLIREKKPFILEHALTRREIFTIINRAKKKGYRIVTYYLHTTSAHDNLRNIRKRVADGGHACSAGKVIWRYHLARWHYARIKRLSDAFYVYHKETVYTIK